MVTQENLLRPGFASVHFERIDETVSGQALLRGAFFHARLSGYFALTSPLPRPNIYAAKGCLQWNLLRYSLLALPLNEAAQECAMPPQNANGTCVCKRLHTGGPFL